MLICNNCNTVNEDHCKKCTHCQMSGNFRRQLGENKSDTLPVLQAEVICRNCGSAAPGDDVKCMHCRFPLVQTSRQVTTQEQVGAKKSPAIHSSEKPL